MKLLTCLFAVFFAVLAGPGIARAEEPALIFKPDPLTHPERILLAFYKVAGLTPDFLAWAKKSPFLTQAEDGDRDSIVSREDNRLRRLYAELDLRDPLVVQTTIRLDDYSTISEILRVSEFTPKTFFQFSMYGENVAIVPKGMTTFADIPMKQSKMDEMLSKSGESVVAQLLLKPVVADAQTPFVFAETPYWLLLAEIAEIRFFTTGVSPKPLWMHRADWYQPKSDLDLMGLKDKVQGQF